MILDLNSLLTLINERKSNLCCYSMNPTHTSKKRMDSSIASMTSFGSISLKINENIKNRNNSKHRLFLESGWQLVFQFNSILTRKLHIRGCIPINATPMSWCRSRMRKQEIAFETMWTEMSILSSVSNSVLMYMICGFHFLHGNEMFLFIYYHKWYHTQ